MKKENPVDPKLALTTRDFRFLDSCNRLNEVRKMNVKFNRGEILWRI